MPSAVEKKNDDNEKKGLSISKNRLVSAIEDICRNKIMQICNFERLPASGTESGWLLLLLESRTALGHFKCSVKKVVYILGGALPPKVAISHNTILQD